MKNIIPTVAITGASGFLGVELVNYFLSKEYRVIGLVRNADQKSKINPLVEYREYDIENPIQESGLAGVDFLVHAAYIKYNSNQPNALKKNVEGAKNLISSAQVSKIKHTVFISTMSAHEDAISVYGKQKLEIEKLFLASKNTTVLRCGLIIGNGGIVCDMAAFMKSKHAVPLIGGGVQPLQIISIRDLCIAIDHSMSDRLSGRFVAANPTVYSYRDFYRSLAHRLNIKIIYIPVPYFALQTLLKTTELLHIPLDVGADNLKGLKKLTAMPSRDDMAKLRVDPVDLQTALNDTKF